MLRLEAINEDNFYHVLDLQVDATQSKFVATNEKSLAECYLYRDNNDVFPFAVMVADKVVGFLLLDTNLEKREIMIWRMMIDHKFQGKGYGRQTILRVIELAQEEQGYDVLIADYVKGNQSMAHLLTSLGFTEQGFNQKFNEYICHYNLLETKGAS